MKTQSRAVSRNEKNLGILSKQYSSRDLPSHTKLKYRQSGQNNTDDLKSKNYRRELQERERTAAHEKEAKKGHSHAISSSATASVASSSAPQLALTAGSSTTSTSSTPASKRLKTDPTTVKQLPLNIDRDDPIFLQDEDDNPRTSSSKHHQKPGYISDEDDDIDSGQDNDSNPGDGDDDELDSDEEDDTAELMAELNRIKKERAAEEARREAEQKEREEQIRMESLLKGGALGDGVDFKVKRRWDDDVVFKNCSRDDLDGKEKPFINDTLRSEFHKKFMEKYIK